MKYVVQYTLPYEHRVMVGIEADSSEEAIRKAESFGSQSKAYIVEPWIEPARIDLNEVFRPIDS